jgi:KaiC/GvpD/RAD55 family RecA-like ATPase
MSDELFQQVTGLDVVELDGFKQANDTVQLIETTFGFIAKHKGLRLGCSHVLLGQTGKGKTTLVRSLIHQHISAGINVGYYMTEESTEDLQTQYAYRQNVSQKDFNFLKTKEERSILIPREDYMAWIEELRQWVKANSLKVLFFDNITTSEFYDGRIDESNKIVNALMDLAKELQFALFLVAHTGKRVIHSKIYTTDDMRGHAAPGLKAHYFYVFHRVRVEYPSDLYIENKDRVFERSFIVVQKSRNHPVELGKVYRLEYDPCSYEYSKDEAEDYDLLVDLLKDKRKK